MTKEPSWFHVFQSLSEDEKVSRKRTDPDSGISVSLAEKRLNSEQEDNENNSNNVRINFFINNENFSMICPAIMGSRIFWLIG
jgi:hypothetical protein